MNFEYILIFKRHRHEILRKKKKSLKIFISRNRIHRDRNQPMMQFRVINGDTTKK